MTRNIISVSITVMGCCKREERMPTVYLRKDLHESIILKHEDVNSFVNRAVEEALRESAPEIKEEPKSSTKTKNIKKEA